MTTSSTRSLNRSVELVEVKPGVRFSHADLKAMLPDVETILFFGKVYKLDAMQLATLLRKLVNTDLTEALFNGEHSTELQHYLVGGYDHDAACATVWNEDLDCTCVPQYYPGVIDPAQQGEVRFDTEAPPPQGEILPHMWENLEVEVAASIAKVVEKLDGVLNLMPGKQGEMVFKTLAKLNLQRPTIGQYSAGIHHQRTTENLVILDVSGSMTEGTIRTIIDDVVALSYKANAHLAIVSNTCTHWVPGSYDTSVVLKAAEYGGTRYEQLVPLLQQDWGTVVTIADYDSSQAAFDEIKAQCKGSIEQVLDISLVNKPSFLAKCVGQLAKQVRPLLIANSSYVLRD